MTDINRLLPSRPPHAPEFGLQAWLEETRVRLPLKGVECRFQVQGDLVNVEIDQIFHQDNPKPLDCFYTFPLPGGAAIYRCEMHVNSRVISARVEELQQAIRFIQEKKAAGHRTALVQMERENLFTLELGNLAPDDIVIIRFAYIQTVTRLADQAGFNIPFCPGVRYIPGTPLLRSNRGRGTADDTDQVPDASRISPPRIDQLHPDAAYLAVTGNIESAPGLVSNIHSPTHPLLVKDGTGTATVNLIDRDAVPDSDLALRWTEAASESMQSVAWSARKGSECFALLRLVAPADAPSAQDYAQEVYCLVDRSGSMGGQKWAKACEALRAFLQALEEQDQVWVTFFATGHQDLAEKPFSPATLLADPAVQSIESIGARGGTELLPALRHVLAAIGKHSPNRNTVILLITDGQVGNEAEVLELMKQHPKIRLHAFGIDTAVNDAFLQTIARQQRGTCHLVTPDEDIVGTVARLGTRLRRPILTHIRIADAWELADGELPDLHAGETIEVPLCGGQWPREIEWEGRRPDGSVARFQCHPREGSFPALPLLWARRRIQDLIASGDRAQAVAFAKEWNLLCPGTAFIAWDETEKIVVGRDRLEVYQPALRPATAILNACLYAPSPASLADQDQMFYADRSRGISEDMVSPRRLGDSAGFLGQDPESAPPRGLPWKAQLLEDEIFRNHPAPVDLIALLERWITFLPTGQREREDKLMELARLFRRLRNLGRPSRNLLAVLRDWLEKTLPAEFREEVQRALLALESRALA